MTTDLHDYVHFYTDLIYNSSLSSRVCVCVCVCMCVVRLVSSSLLHLNHNSSSSLACLCEREGDLTWMKITPSDVVQGPEAPLLGITPLQLMSCLFFFLFVCSLFPGGFAAEKGCHPPDGDFHRYGCVRACSPAWFLSVHTLFARPVKVKREAAAEYKTFFFAMRLFMWCLWSLLCTSGILLWANCA